MGTEGTKRTEMQWNTMTVIWCWYRLRMDSTTGTSKKLHPKFKGPFWVRKILINDRYKVVDLWKGCRQGQMIIIADCMKYLDYNPRCVSGWHVFSYELVLQTRRNGVDMNQLNWYEVSEPITANWQPGENEGT